MVLAQYQDFLPTLKKSPVGRGWKRRGEDTTRAAVLNYPKGYSVLSDALLSKKSWRNGRRRGTLVMKVFSWAITTRTETLLPKTWLNIVCWWEADNNYFYPMFLLPAGFGFVFFPFNYTVLISTQVSFLPLYFSSILLVRGRERMV